MRMYNISNHPVETSFKFNFKGFGGFREATGRVLVAAEKKKKKKIARGFLPTHVI